jgi:hypothetical protein
VYFGGGSGLLPPETQMHESTEKHCLFGSRLADPSITRGVDCSFLLRGTLGEPLRDPEYFRQVRVDEEARTVVWPNGLDPAPELLYSGGQASVTVQPPVDRAHA